jgi:hypothetical protein
MTRNHSVPELALWDRSVRVVRFRVLLIFSYTQHTSATFCAFHVSGSTSGFPQLTPKKASRDRWQPAKKHSKVNKYY